MVRLNNRKSSSLFAFQFQTIMRSASLSIFSLYLLRSAGLAVAQSCDGVRERKAWNKLTDTEQTTFLNAVIALKQHDGSAIGGVDVLSYDAFVQTHEVNVFEAHSFNGPVEEFLTWHRWFLWQYETALRLVSGDCSITLPFWEWELDFEDPGASAPLGPLTFGSVNGLGGRGRPSVKYGVTEGIAACSTSYWSTTVLSGSCLERSFNDRDGSFTSQAGLLNVITANAIFEDFFLPLEGTPHGVPHIYVGRHMADIRFSPDDPLFYLHHCNVDRVLALWQDYRNHDQIAPADLGAEQFSGDLDLPMAYNGPDGAQPFLQLNDAYPTPREVLLNNDLVKVAYADDSLSQALVNALAGDGDPTNDYTPNQEWFPPGPTAPNCGDGRSACGSNDDCCSGNCRNNQCKGNRKDMRRGLKGLPWEKAAGPPVWANPTSQRIWQGLMDRGVPAVAAIHELAVAECGSGNPIQVPQAWMDQMPGMDEKYFRCYVE